MFYMTQKTGKEDIKSTLPSSRPPVRQSIHPSIHPGQLRSPPSVFLPLQEAVHLDSTARVIVLKPRPGRRTVPRGPCCSQARTSALGPCDALRRWQATAPSRAHVLTAPRPRSPRRAPPPTALSTCPCGPSTAPSSLGSRWGWAPGVYFSSDTNSKLAACASAYDRKFLRLLPWSPRAL